MINLTSPCLGDNIYAIPAINYLSHFRKIDVNILVKDYLPLFESIFWNHKNIQLSNKITGETEIDNYVLYRYKIENIIDLWFEAIGIKEHVNSKYKIFPKIQPTKKLKNSICLHVTYRVVQQKLSKEIWNQIIQIVKDNGYIPILIGNTPPDHSPITKGCSTKYYVDDIDTNDTINYINKLSIIETLDLIAGSDYLITPLDGMYTLSLLTNTPVITTLTYMDYKTLEPYNKGQVFQYIETLCPDKFCLTDFGKRKTNKLECKYNFQCINNFGDIDKIPFIFKREL